MANAEKLQQAMNDLELETIEDDGTLEEYDIGEAPVDDEDSLLPVDGEDEDERISDDMEVYQDDAVRVYTMHNEPVYALAVHPTDPRIVLTGGGDDVGMIWNREDNSVLHTLSGHSDSVVAVGFSFDGQYAATGGYDGVVKVWDVASGALVQNLEGPSQEVEWICWHKKGYVILAGSGDGTVWMWLATTGECMHVFAGHEDTVSCGSFTGSGKMVVTGSGDATVRLWNPKTGECAHVFRGRDFHEGPICTLACHPSQPLMISGSQDGSARLLQLQAKRVLATFSHDVDESRIGTISGEAEETTNYVECAGFCTSMNWAATGCLGGYLRIWDLAGHQCRHVCRHDSGVIKLVWHPTQPIVYTGTIEGVICAWDARSGEQLRTFRGHTDMILDLSLVMNAAGTEPDYLISASDDGTVRLFALA